MIIRKTIEIKEKFADKVRSQKTLPTREQQNLSAFLSLCAATFVTIVIGIILNTVPNILNTEHILGTYNIEIENFVAETSEKLQYIVCTVIFPISYILFHVLFKNFAVKGNAAVINQNLSILQIVTSLAILVYLNFINSFYFKTAALSNNGWIILMYTMFVLVLLVISMNIYENIFDRRVISLVLYLTSLTIIFFIAKLYITGSYAVAFWHFDAYFYPIYKVYCGQTPLVDFNCLYGFYPYFLVPIFKIFGGISIYRFSIVIAAMVFLSLGAITSSLFLLCRNKVLALFGSLAVVFTISIAPMLYQEPYFLQYFPHRTLFPSLLLLLCSVLLTLRDSSKRKYFEWSGFVLVSLSLIWNIDTGVIVFVSYCGFLLYIKLYTYPIHDKRLRRYAFYVIAGAVLAFVIAVVILYIITYLRTKTMINPRDIIYGQTSFYGDGFYMIRMKLIQPWLILIGIYMISLVKAIRDISFLRLGEPIYSRAQSSIYFLLPVLGMGLFSYYQGRSHDFVFPFVLWPGVFLLVMFAQEYAGNIWADSSKNILSSQILVKANSLPIVKLVLSGLVISFIAISLIVNLLDDTRLTLTKSMGPRVAYYTLDEALGLYDYYGSNGKSINLLMCNSTDVYCLRNDTNIPNVPATIDLFTKEDYAKCIRYLKSTNKTTIFDVKTFNLLNKYCEAEFEDCFLNRYSESGRSEFYLVYTKNE